MSKEALVFAVHKNCQNCTGLPGSCQRQEMVFSRAGEKERLPFFLCQVGIWWLVGGNGQDYDRRSNDLVLSGEPPTPGRDSDYQSERS